MADNPIKQKIILEGEKQYRDAIRDAQRNLKTLRSELKAETAELGANATAQEKNAAKIKSLQKQIKEQEKIVNANKDALAEVKEKYGDNADAIAKYEQKLNESRTALANMKNELDTVGQSFKGVETNAAQATVATKSVSDALGKIGDVGETVSGAIESVFTGLMSTVREVALEIWDLIAETAAKADRWGDLAGFYGSTAEEVQRVDRAISAAGGNFEDFVSLMNTLQFKGKDKKLVDWLGLSDVNYDNEIENAMAALSLMSEKKKELGTGKFNEQLAEVFGGKSSGFLQLIDKYDEIIKKSYELKENGYLMDGEGIDTLATISNTIASIDEKWDALKSKIAEGLGQSTLNILTHVEGGLDALARYFNAETDADRQTALDGLKKELTGAFTELAAAIRDGIQALSDVSGELKESEDPIVSTIGSILGGLADAMTWLTEENANNFKSALIIIAGAWGLAKVATMITRIAELGSALMSIKIAGGISALTSLLGSGGAVAVGAEIGTTAGASFLSSVAAGLGSVLIGVLLAIPILDMIKNPDKYLNPHKEEKTEEQKELEKKDDEKSLEEKLKLVTKNPKETNKGFHKVVDEFLYGKQPAKNEPPEGYKINASGQLVPDNTSGLLPALGIKPTKKILPVEGDWHTIRTADGRVVSMDLPNVNEDLHMTADQWAAAQKWWDEVERGQNGEFTDEQFEAFEKAFAGNEEVFDQLNEMIDYLKQANEETDGKSTWQQLEDLPATWWQQWNELNGGNTGNGMTAEDAKSVKQAVDKMPGAVTKGLSGVKIYMDKTVVGSMVAEEVSRQIATYVIG